MESRFTLRDATKADYPEILYLNDELVRFLSPLDGTSLTTLADEAELFKVVVCEQSVAAFLIALREGKRYQSPNYRWFCGHYERFLYIDRVVVSERFQHCGLGKALYGEVFAHAEKLGVERIAAEIDIAPPNPKSLQFHASFGFCEVGTQYVAGGKKQVSLEIADSRK